MFLNLLFTVTELIVFYKTTLTIKSSCVIRHRGRNPRKIYSLDSEQRNNKKFYDYPVLYVAAIFVDSVQGSGRYNNHKN